MAQNLSHESYRDDEPVGAGSDRRFGCTVGSVLMIIGAAKALMAEAVSSFALLIFVAGAVLLLFGVAAPSRLSALKQLWFRLGAVLAKVVNPIVLALLFFGVVTPMALIMYLAGKRLLRLAPDRTAASYWIPRERPEDSPSGMTRQF